jgi:8-oxo-dGTP diphosphatase
MNSHGTLIGTKVVVLNRRGKILILRRSESSARPLGWDFPGGALEPGEDPEKGALRELQEETGIVSEKAQLYDAQMAGKVMQVYANFTLLLAYKVRVDTSEVQISREHESYQWMSREEVLALPMPSLLKNFLEKLPA